MRATGACLLLAALLLAAVPASGAPAPVELIDAAPATVSGPLAIPDAAAVLAPTVAAREAGRAALVGRRDALVREAGELTAAIAGLDASIAEHDERAADAERRVRRLAAGAYVHVGRSGDALAGALALDDPVVAARHVRIADGGMRAHAARGAAARAAAEAARAERAARAGRREEVEAERAAVERELAWLDDAVTWVASRRADDQTAPMLVGTDLTIAQLDAALAATRRARCRAPWPEVAASLAPGVGEAAGDWRAAAVRAAARVCEGAHGDEARAERYAALGLPDRPPARVVVVGDSLAEGARRAGLVPQLERDGWEPLVDAEVGRTTRESLAALRERAPPGGERVAAVVLVSGSNDGTAAAPYAAALRDLLARYPEARIIAVPPVMADRAAMVDAARSLAGREPRLTVVVPSGDGGDGVHLSAAGYGQLVAAVAAALAG